MLSVNLKARHLVPGDTVVERGESGRVVRRIPVKDTGICNDSSNCHVVTDAGKTLCYYRDADVEIQS